MTLCCWFALARRLVVFLSLCTLAPMLPAADSSISGGLTDPQNRAVSGAIITILRRADSSRRETKTDDQGQFTFLSLEPGEYRLTAEAARFPIITRNVTVPQSGSPVENLQFSQIASQNQSMTVSADVGDAGLFAPDRAQRIMIRDETLDANPGRVREIVEVPVPRPRTPEQIFSPSFMAVRQHIDHLIHPPGQEQKEAPVLRHAISDPDVV